MDKIDYKEVVSFHGHSCPGLAIGYKACIAANENNFFKSTDEELMAIVENNSCSVDAIQYILSCTFGKGNLFFRDYGKQAFTIIKRQTGEAIRISLKPIDRDRLSREKFFDLIMTSNTKDIFNIKKFKVTENEIPQKARIHQSIICENCKEPTMETRIKHLNSKKLCVECYEKLVK